MEAIISIPLIEEALLGNDSVAFAGAIGQPCLTAGELPCVYVELVAGATVTAEELKAYCEANIPERAAHPKHVEILDELPKLQSGRCLNQTCVKEQLPECLMKL